MGCMTHSVEEQYGRRKQGPDWVSCIQEGVLWNSLHEAFLQTKTFRFFCTKMLQIQISRLTPCRHRQRQKMAVVPSSCTLASSAHQGELLEITANGGDPQSNSPRSPWIGLFVGIPLTKTLYQETLSFRDFSGIALERVFLGKMKFLGWAAVMHACQKPLPTMQRVNFEGTHNIWTVNPDFGDYQLLGPPQMGCLRNGDLGTSNQRFLFL